ncbi:MAG: hypothetical protein ACI4KM_01315 [Oscillospiraceae bacterium]
MKNALIYILSALCSLAAQAAAVFFGWVLFVIHFIAGVPGAIAAAFVYALLMTSVYRGFNRRSNIPLSRFVLFTVLPSSLAAAAVCIISIISAKNGAGLWGFAPAASSQLMLFGIVVLAVSLICSLAFIMVNVMRAKKTEE